MTISSRLFGTRVARRILSFFIVSAIVPVLVLAVISWVRVVDQLDAQARLRVREATEAMGQSAAERLQLIELDLRGIANAARAGQSLSESVANASVQSDRFALVEQRAFQELARVMSEDELAHIRRGGSVVSVESSAGQHNLVMVRAMDASDIDLGVMWAVLNPTAPWGLDVAGSLPMNMEFCAFAHGMIELYCSPPIAPYATTISSGLEPLIAGGAHSGTLDWRTQDGDHIAGYWPVFLKAVFETDEMTIVLSQSRASVLEAMRDFKLVFLFAVIMAIWVVLLISPILIRKSMDPLRRLQEGTRHIARKEFGQPVEIQSGDEFEELGESFNSMAKQLDRQFRTLESRSDIDRAILSTLKSDQIYETVLTRANHILACDSVSIAVPSSDNGDGDWSLISQRGNGERVDGVVHFTEEAAAQLDDGSRYAVARRGDALYDMIPANGTAGSMVLFPLFVKQELAGLIVARYAGSDPPSEDLQDGRQLSDQVAVALSNTHLVEELDELNWGALTALARAIDAKSSWTAGHSERVTQLSLAIARELGLDDEQYDVLHRGGLLHDIGKIGIPPEVLDKPGKLSEEEFKVMSAHTTIGASILEPMTAYANAIPIVLHHHEKWDGSGYPHGLSGENIPYLARLVAVADVFDALTSDRPYRSSWSLEKAVDVIKKDAGSHFDPAMVKPFVVLMEREPEQWGQKRERVQSVLERRA